MKKFSWFLALIIAFFPIIGFADYETGYKTIVRDVKESELLLETPPENVFRLAGDDQEFILLDTGETDESKFFVMSKQGYGQVSFSSDLSQKFDPENSKNIAYVLNHQFKERTYNNMTPQIFDYVDNDHEWTTEPGNENGAGDTAYTAKCGLAVISLTEYYIYKDKIGIVDKLSNTDGWWTRTARVGGSPDNVFIIGVNKAVNLLGNIVEWRAAGGANLRPVFWLNKKFFEENKLDLNNTGENVFKALKNVYKAEELQNEKTHYLNHEMRAMGFSVDGIDEIFKADFFEAPEHIMDDDEAGFDLKASITGSKTLEYDLTYSLGEKSWSEKISVQPNVKFSKKVIFDKPLKGVQKATVKVERAGTVLLDTEEDVTIIDVYKKQFMDEYSRMRMCTQFEVSYNIGHAPKQLSIMKKAGILKIRDTIEWARVEKPDNAWDFTIHDEFMSYCKDQGVDVAVIAAFSSPLHIQLKDGGKFDSKYAPTTLEELDAFCEYVRQLVTHYPELTVLEIWNESNWQQFWKPEPNALDYATMVKMVSETVRAVRPDIKIIGGSLVYGKMPFFSQWLDQNVSPYVDAYSTHPYSFPNSVDTTPAVVARGAKIFNRYGGFVDWYSTEVGLPNSTNSYGISEEGQADAYAKYAVYSDSEHFEESMWYDFRDNGTVPSNNEHNFGIIKFDYKTKPVYAAVSQSSNVLNGSIYIGKLNLGNNVNAFVYLKDKEPIIVLWNTKDGAEEITIEHTRAEDMYGNEVALEETFAVDKNLRYLYGVSRDYIIKASYDTAIAAYEKYLDEYEASDAQQERIKAAIDNLKDYDAAKADGALRENIDIGSAIIENKGDTPNVKISSMLNYLRYAHEALAGAYCEMNRDNAPVDLSAIRILKENLQAQKSGDINIQKPFTEKILRYADKYNTRIEEIKGMADNPGKNIAIKYYEALAGLAAWADDFDKIEALDEHLGVVVHTSPSTATIYQGETQKIDVTVRNENQNGLNNAKAFVMDEKGDVVFETESFNIKSKESVDTELEIYIPDSKTTGSYEYILEIRSGNNTISRQSLYVTVKGVVSVALLPVKSSLMTTKKIELEVTNTYNKVLAFTVNIKAPDGWKLKKNTKQSAIGINSKKVLTFDVEKAIKTPFNHYEFEITILNTKGEELIKQVTPLNMPISVMNKDGVAAQDFDGDITSWQNAYPVYINPPQNIYDKESWRALESAGRMFTKWDNKYLYVLCDVYDDTHIQNYKGVSLYNGDGIQLSIDTLNDKSTSYKTDDYELGFGFTEQGEDVYAWQNGADEIGALPSEWTKIFRDKEERLTRYYVRIPWDRLNNIKPKKGLKYGLNVVINDADLIDRDKFSELTLGTATTKNPSYYMDWVMWNYEVIKKDQTMDDVSVVLKPDDMFHSN